MKQKGSPMCTVDLIEHEGGQVVAVLRGELDVAYAASLAARLAVIASRECEVIVDLAGLEFMDSSGLAALVQARKHARHAGSDLLLAAPQQQVLRLLTVTRPIDDFLVYACVDDAASRARQSSPASLPMAPPAVLLAAS
jgi:anti-sigma B factor antagonist